MEIEHIGTPNRSLPPPPQAEKIENRGGDIDQIESPGRKKSEPRRYIGNSARHAMLLAPSFSIQLLRDGGTL